MDAVILAGGKSERLRGIVPPHFKPFVVIAGKSLLVSAVDSAIEAGAQRVVVVATGENALPVWQLIGHLDDVRVVLSDRGVGDAVARGLEVCTAERTLVLMSDNVHADDDVMRVVSAPEYGIGVRDVPHAEALRFTRQSQGRWVENPVTFLPPPPGDTTRIWCGPLVINRELGLHVLPNCHKLGSWLDQLVPTRYTHVQVSTQDVGIPEVVTELTRR